MHRCDIEREPLPFKTGQFDAVVLNEVFEHLRINPIATMAEVRRVMAPGSKLMLSTPNARSLYGMKNFLFHDRSSSPNVFREYSKLDELGHMGHVREYTAREVSDFLAHFDLRTIMVIHRGSLPLIRLSRPLLRIMPRLRPFVSIVAIAE